MMPDIFEQQRRQTEFFDNYFTLLEPLERVQYDEEEEANESWTN